MSQGLTQLHWKPSTGNEEANINWDLGTCNRINIQYWKRAEGGCPIPKLTSGVSIKRSRCAITLMCPFSIENKNWGLDDCWGEKRICKQDKAVGMSGIWEHQAWFFRILYKVVLNTTAWNALFKLGFCILSCPLCFLCQISICASPCFHTVFNSRLTTELTLWKIRIVKCGN